MKKNSEKQREYNALQQKLLQLEQNNSIVLDKLKMARLDGDISDNGDLTSLEREMEVLQRQILFIKKKLVAMEKNNEKNKIITYQLLESEEEKTIELVSEWETNPFQNKISPFSPLGLVLAQKKVGEVGEVQTKQKSYKIKVLNVKEK